MFPKRMMGPGENRLPEALDLEGARMLRISRRRSTALSRDDIFFVSERD
jgi:hypothetical protein